MARLSQVLRRGNEQAYGHVILDLHPNTHSQERIVKTNQPNSAEPVSAMDLLKQYFNLMNPYGAALVELQKLIDKILNDSSIPDQEKVAKHVQMMNDYKLLAAKYRTKEGGTVPVQIQSISTPVEKDALIKEKETEENIPALESETHPQLFNPTI